MNVEVLKYPPEEDWTITVKDKLLRTGYFVDNKFMNNYCELISNNRYTRYEQFKTQRHHILPRTYYKELKIDIDNSDNNLVNLYYSDHVLAHYYLAFCAKEGRLKYKLLCAFRFSFGANKSKDSDVELISKQMDLQKIYEETKFNVSKYRTGSKNKPMSKQGRLNISMAHIGKTPPNKGKPISPETREKLIAAHSGKTLSASCRKKMSLARKGIPHSNDWNRKIGESLIGHNVSAETKDKISRVNKGKKWITNGDMTIFVEAHKVDEYFEKGFRYGRK